MPISRRDFLKSGAAAIAGFTIAPSSILGKSHGHISPTDKLNIGVVGIGGIGHSNINAVKGTENIVALCDVNWDYAKGVFDEFPKAKRFWDYRKMYEEMGKSMDAVIIATADHTHAIITADAMTLGKHVYCQKPLTHSVYESRLLTKLAKSTGVATQMGNQGASWDGTQTVCDWIWNGEIGEVTRVDCATDRPIWPQGLNEPETVDDIPASLNWDLFTGPARLNPYNKVYQPWNWRGWWDYGARDNMAKVGMPEVEVHWYDGGLMPDRPKGFPQGKELMQAGGGLTIFHGTKDTLICGCYGQNPWLLSGRKPNAPQVARRVKVSHEMDWVNACKESPKYRHKCNSDFSEVRLQGLNKVLEWDGENMRFTNIGENETIKTCIKDGFTIHNGHPSFNKTWTEPQNAIKLSQELIKHTYRDGWKLPDMPK